MRRGLLSVTPDGHAADLLLEAAGGVSIPYRIRSNASLILIMAGCFGFLILSQLLSPMR